MHAFGGWRLPTHTTPSLIPTHLCSPKKYPGRDNTLTGGWAGGEVGLKAFITDSGAAAATPPAKPAGKAAGRAAQPISQGGDVIYIGKGKSIKGDARKYPGEPLTCREGLGREQAVREEGVPAAAGGWSQPWVDWLQGLLPPCSCGLPGPQLGQQRSASCPPTRPPT